MMVQIGLRINHPIRKTRNPQSIETVNKQRGVVTISLLHPPLSYRKASDTTKTCTLRQYRYICN